MAYKYTIDGKVYRSETPLSDDDLEELSGSAAPQGDYRAEAARKGLASSVGTLTGLGRTLAVAQVQSQLQLVKLLRPEVLKR